MNKYIGVMVVLFAALSVIAQNPTKQDFKFKPIDLTQAISQMHILEDDSSKVWIKSISEDEYVSSVQYSQGIWIRNNWKLWKGGDLAQYFKRYGIHHPEEMSEIIFRVFHRDMHNKAWNSEALIDSIIAAKRAIEVHQQRMQSDPEYRMKVEAEDKLKLVAYYQELREKYDVGKDIYVILPYNCYNKNKTRVFGKILEHGDKNVKIEITGYEDDSKASGVLKCNEIVDNLVWVDLPRVYFIDEKPAPIIFRATPY